MAKTPSRRERTPQRPSPKSNRSARKTDAPDPVEAALLELAKRPDYVPLDSLGLSRALKSRGKMTTAAVCAALDRLEKDGTLVRIKGDRFALPHDADLLTGRIQFRASGSAWVTAEAEAYDPSEPDAPRGRPDEVQVFQEDASTAFHGDRVVVRIERQPRLIRGKEVRAGRVIRILSRANPTIVGSLQKSRHYFHVIPDDPRLVHDILVPDPRESKVKPPPRPGDKVVVKLLEWNQRHAPPEGEIEEVLGRNTEPGTELRAIFRKHNLPEKFPEAVLAEVRHLPDTVPAEQLAGREDFRDIPTCTIDPDDAKDFDDALSYEALPGGRVRVGVHIADVSTYVRPGSALDREARQRGNSTYLIGTVVPMLPEKLSNGLCSLVEGQDRLTKAAIFTFAADGTLEDTRFANTVIRSRKRLTYKQAHALLIEESLDAIRAVKPPPSHQTGSPGRPLSSLSDDELRALRHWVREFWRLGKQLRSERMAAGSLDLEMPETKIFVDASGWAERIERIEHDESHQLIEEFMLLANEALARRTRQRKLPSVYRVHDEPDSGKLQEFRDYAATFGLSFGNLAKREEVVALLLKLRTHPQGHTLRSQFLRSLRKACYRPEPDGHYGLHKKDYTHFTSPIRRYADLLAHRVLAFDIASGGQPSKGAKPPHSASEIRGLAEHISLTETNSAEAEREHHKIKLVEFFERDLERDPRTRFPAVITDIRNHGLFIELTEPFMLGFVHVSALKDDFYSLAPDGTALVGRRSRRTFKLNDHIRVEIDRVDRIKRQFDFRVVEDKTPGNRTPDRAERSRHALGDEHTRHAREFSREQRKRRRMR